MLLTLKYIRLRRASKKLANKYLGPFKVVEKVGKNTYILELLKKYGRLYIIFYVSLLEAYYRREGYVTPKPIDINDE